MNRPSWTITEASTRCGVSKSTIRRYREGGKFPNAWKDKSNPPQWRIPVEDLLANGLKSVDTYEAPAEHALSAPSERERELEMLLEVERAKRAAAEQVAAIAMQAASDLSTAMKMLEARPVVQPESTPEQPQRQPTEIPAEAPAEPPTRRRWWQVFQYSEPSKDPRK